MTETEKKEQQKKLSILLTFLGADLVFRFWGSDLTLWSTLNAYQEHGYTCIGEEDEFHFTLVGKGETIYVSLEDNEIEVSFDTISDEEFFYDRVKSVSMTVERLSPQA
jgi:hypothetical protein